MKNLIMMFLLSMMLVGCSMSCSSGPATTDLGDDNIRFRKIASLIKAYNEDFLKAGAAGDSAKMKVSYDMVMSLEQNRLGLLKRVLEKNGNRLADEIIVDKKKGVYWNDGTNWKQGDFVETDYWGGELEAPLAEGYGVIVSPSMFKDRKGDLAVMVCFEQGVFPVSVYNLVSVTHDKMSERLLAYAEKVLKGINGARGKND